MNNNTCAESLCKAKPPARFGSTSTANWTRTFPSAARRTPALVRVGICPSPSQPPRCLSAECCPSHLVAQWHREQRWLGGRCGRWRNRPRPSRHVGNRSGSGIVRARRFAAGARDAVQSAPVRGVGRSDGSEQVRPAAVLLAALIPAARPPIIPRPSARHFRHPNSGLHNRRKMRRGNIDCPRLSDTCERRRNIIVWPGFRTLQASGKDTGEGRRQNPSTGP